MGGDSFDGWEKMTCSFPNTLDGHLWFNLSKAESSLATAQKGVQWLDLTHLIPENKPF